MIRQSVHLWTDPLLIPSALITDHLSRIQNFCGRKLTEQVMEVEDKLGVIRVGRRLKRNELPPQQHSDSAYAQVRQNFLRGEPVERSEAMDLTILINSHYTKTIFSKRSPVWNRQTAEFLLTVSSELTGKLAYPLPYDYEISELLEHNIQVAKSMEDHVAGLQTRLDLQLNVVSQASRPPRSRANRCSKALQLCCANRQSSQCPVGSYQWSRQHLHEDPCLHYDSLPTGNLRRSTFKTNANPYEILADSPGIRLCSP
jgi:hypothetical protein